MNTITDTIQNPVWWFSVVVVGILVNWIARYTPICLARIWGSLGARLKSRRELEDQEVIALTENSKLLYLKSLEANRFRIAVIQNTLWGIVFWLMAIFTSIQTWEGKVTASGICSLLGSILFVAASTTISKSIYLERVVRRATSALCKSAEHE